MNTGTLRSRLADSILRRTDLTSAQLLYAINLAMLQMQRDHDWPCQESHQTLQFDEDQADGATLPDDYKTTRSLWEVDDTTDQRTDVEITASTEYEMRSLKLAHTREGGHASLTIDQHHQRWWEEEGRIRLLFPIDERLWLDYFAYLPDLVEDTDENWFTNYAHDALIYGAAWQLSIAGFEDERSMMFRNNFDTFKQQAYESAIRLKAGQMARVHRPPTNWRKR